MADSLDALAAGLLANRRRHRFPGRAVWGVQPDLHEFMVFERLFDLLEHGGRQSALSGRHDRLAGVCKGTQLASLSGGEHRISVTLGSAVYRRLAGITYGTAGRHAEAGGRASSRLDVMPIATAATRVRYNACIPTRSPGSLMKRRPSSSKAWLREHHADSYVKQARKEGYRSRAAFKLLEIDRRDRLLRPGMRVLDLGAAPGGWSQIAAGRVGASGRVIALDLLYMPPLPGVEFVQGDINDMQLIEKIREDLSGSPVDLVMSDMAPNISGMDAIDQPRSLHLAELVLDTAEQFLRPGGDLLVKVFQGAGTERYIRELRARFARVVLRKPQSSRPRSREVYVLGRDFRGAGHAVG